MSFRLLPFLMAFVAATVQAAPLRVVVDMTGDQVTLPTQVEHVATIGAPPVLNGFVFAVGEGRCIVNCVPEFTRKPRWGYRSVFAPHTVTPPQFQNHDRRPNLEALFGAASDAVLTADRASADALRRTGLPALYLGWRQPEDVKTAVNLLGRIFDKPQAAERFDRMLADVAARLHVLHFSLWTMTQPHLVGECWIRATGGQRGTDDSSVKSRSFTLEQLLAWNPDILIAISPEEAVRREPPLSLSKPCVPAAASWSHPTAPTPGPIVASSSRSPCFGRQNTSTPSALATSTSSPRRKPFIGTSSAQISLSHRRAQSSMADRAARRQLC